MQRRWRIGSVEFVTSTAVIAVCMAVLLNRIAAYEELAEKTRVELTIAQIRTGLRYAQMEALLHRQEVPIEVWLRRNPMDWLAQPPADYHGAVSRLPTPPARGWYYLEHEHALVYLPRLQTHLASGWSERPVRLIWQVQAGPSLRLESVVLEARPYQWF
jgi:hypothetical protein